MSSKVKPTIFTRRLNVPNFLFGMSILFAAIAPFLYYLGSLIPESLALYRIPLVGLFFFLMIVLTIRRGYDHGVNGLVIVFDMKWSVFWALEEGDKGSNEFGEPQKGVGLLQILGFK